MGEVICTRCRERPVEEGKRKCRECLQAFNDYQKQYRATQRKEDRCQSCDRVGAGGMAFCKKCREEVKEKKEAFVAAGLCAHCGKFPPRPKRKMCEKCTEYERTYKKKNEKIGLCKKCGKHPPEEGFKQCKKCSNQNRDIHRAVREEALQAYGGACACCGETTKEFLQLDHKNNDGAKHRREIGRGTTITWWAKKNGYPNNLQILCSNCNNAKAFYGICPHQLNKEVHNVEASREHVRKLQDATTYCEVQQRFVGYWYF